MKWSLTGGGREVVAMKELTVVSGLTKGRGEGEERQMDFQVRKRDSSELGHTSAVCLLFDY